MRLLNVHDHLCLIYKTRAEQFAAVLPFVQIGLERGEKCVYIADENSASDVMGAMKEAGIDVDGAVESGALTIAGKQDVYLRQGYFDPDLMIDFLKESTEAAKEAGYSALRVTGEMTWMLGGDPGVERLIEYESKLNRFFPDHDCLAVCQYNRDKFSPEIILDVIRTHRLVIYEDLVCSNYNYIPTDEFLAETEPKKEVERVLANIVALQEGREETGRWKDLVRFLPLMIVTLAPDHKIMDLNAEAERLYKCRRDQAIGHDYLQLFVPEAVRSTVAADIEKVLAGEATRAFESPVIAADGRERMLRWHVTRLLPIDGTPAGVVAVGEDVTERKQSEEALKQSEANFRAVTETTGAAIFIIQGTKFRYQNQAAEVLTGYGPEEISRLNFWDIVHPDFQDLVKARGAARLRGEKVPSRYEFKVITKGGEERWLDYSGTIINFEGRPAILGTALDVTEKKRVQEAEKRRELDIRQAYVDVLAAVTGGKLIIATPEEISATLGRPIGKEMTVATSADISEAKEAAKDIVRDELPGMDVFGFIIAAVEALANAVKHGGGGRLRLYRGDGGKMQIVIEDSGPGIDFSLLPKATLTVGFSTKQSLGMGFGIMLEECDRVLLATEPGRTIVVLEKGLRAGTEKYSRRVA